MATNIEWTDETWNPTAGCSIHSPGCTNCYAMKMARRLEAMGQERYAGLTQVVNGNTVWTGEVRCVPEKLTEPLRWRKPRRVFVDSSVVQRVDLITQAVADFVDLGSFNLLPRSDPRIYREGRHQSGLFTLDSQVRQNGFAEKPRAFTEDDEAVLRLPVRVSASPRVVVKLAFSSLQPPNQPINDPLVRHRDADDWIDRAVSLRPDRRHVDGALTINQPGDVGTLLGSERRDRVRRFCCFSLGLQPQITCSVVLLFADKPGSPVHPACSVN